jgi:hypothetical protein
MNFDRKRLLVRCYHSLKAGYYSGPLSRVKHSAVEVIKQLWRGADLGPTITFATGIITGLLIPSRDWPAIIIVIVSGVVLQRIVKPPV